MEGLFNTKFLIRHDKTLLFIQRCSEKTFYLAIEQISNTSIFH